MKIRTEPLVSIVINCRNSEMFLEETLGSVLHQTYKNFEVIIWDNNSTDSTASIIKKYQLNDHRFKYFYGDHFVNLGRARNFALKKCKGDFIAFLDSDDVWDLNFLTDQMNILYGNDDKYFGYGKVIEFTNKIPKIEYLNKTALNKKRETTFEKLLEGNFIYFSSIVVSRLGINLVREFKENFIQSEDYDLLLRLSRKFEGVQTGYVFYRLHDNNFSKFQKLETYTENLTILRDYLLFANARINYSKNLARFFIYSIQKNKKRNFWNFIQEHKNWVFYLIIGLFHGIRAKLYK